MTSNVYFPQILAGNIDHGRHSQLAVAMSVVGILIYSANQAQMSMLLRYR